MPWLLPKGSNLLVAESYEYAAATVKFVTEVGTPANIAGVFGGAAKCYGSTDDYEEDGSGRPSSGDPAHIASAFAGGLAHDGESGDDGRLPSDRRTRRHRIASAWPAGD